MKNNDISDDETGGASSQLEPYSDDSDGDQRRSGFYYNIFVLLQPQLITGTQPRYSLRILNLPKKTKETHLREALKNEFKKYGQIRTVELIDKDDNRECYIFMSERKEVKRAVDATDGRLLFGALIDVYDNSSNEKQ